MKFIAALLPLIFAPMLIFCMEENNILQKEQFVLTPERTNTIRTFLLEYPSKSVLSNTDISNFLNEQKQLTELVIETSTPKNLTDYFGQNGSDKVEQALEQIYNQAKQEEETKFILTPSAQHVLNIVSSGIVGGFLWYVKGKSNKEQQPDYVSNVFNTLLGGLGVNVLTSIGHIFGYNSRNKENKKIIQGYELRKENIEFVKKLSKNENKIENQNDDSNFDTLLEKNQDQLLSNEFNKNNKNENFVQIETNILQNTKYFDKYSTDNKKNIHDDNELDKFNVDEAEETLNKIEKDVKQMKRNSSTKNVNDNSDDTF